MDPSPPHQGSVHPEDIVFSIYIIFISTTVAAIAKVIVFISYLLPGSGQKLSSLQEICVVRTAVYGIIQTILRNLRQDAGFIRIVQFRFIAVVCNIA